MKSSTKSVQNVKNSLKFKAHPKAGILSVKVGVKKYQIPLEARMISSDGYMFLSFPACSELFRIDSKNLRAMNPAEDASEAFTVLNPSRRRNRRRNINIDVPPALAEALRAVPPGFKLGYTDDGNPKLVKTRRRSARRRKE